MRSKILFILNVFPINGVGAKIIFMGVFVYTVVEYESINMNSIKVEIKNRVLVMYLKHRFKVKSSQVSKNISWIKSQHLAKLVKEHCNALMQVLLNDKQDFSFREKKFIVDNILNTSFEKGLSHMKANAQINMIKPMLHLNSYIIYEEFTKGVIARRSKKNIGYNINRELTIVSEEIAKKSSVEEVLDQRIGV